MRIGIVGPKPSCEKVKKNMMQIDPSLEVSTYSREKISACKEVLPQCMAECDAILFTGCAIESYLSEMFEINKPYTSVEKSIISVAGAFLEMQKQNMELDAFSIDVVENQMIEDLLDAFQILARNIYSCPFQPGVDEQEYVSWHISLQKEGKTNVALTSFAWVYQTLQKEGYNAIYLGPTRAMVRHALDRLKNKYALNQAEYAQIAVEILQLTNYEHLQENYYAGRLEKAEIEKEIIHYVKGIQASIFAFGRREYVIFANAGVIKEKSNQNRILKLQNKIKERGIFLNAGIGMGVTSYKAEMNARQALDYTLKRNKMEIFQIDENDVLDGPLGLEQQLKYELISSDPKIQEIASKMGLSVRSVLKIIAIAETRKSYVFDAHELAECLEVTVRSARRIMNKILDAGFGAVYAKETAISGGRPKTLIEIQFR